ncbi:hypothetical protein BLNAU_22119 [Blattamonas nauphoetae]|uniref:PHD-type domain-containing protein n=1 Tax=Blattamonas nauphoetae TaxID=2049346 RepID=A0ABQ9WTY1_9EUKA|nr:hypothetical protein BLNAU_22119 [Blattamonas nauphoetae]
MTTTGSRRTSTQRTAKQDSTQLYCICRTPYEPGQFMIQCDSCKEWYHGKCVGITPEKADSLKAYFCDKCNAKTSSDSKRAPSSDTASKPQKDLRKEVVEHVEIILKKACKATLETLRDATTPKDGTTVDPDKVTEIEGQIAKVSAFESNDEKIHNTSVAIEQALIDAYKSENEKAYRNQYRTIRTALTKDDYHKIRLRFLLEEMTPAELASNADILSL